MGLPLPSSNWASVQRLLLSALMLFLLAWCQPAHGQLPRIRLDSVFPPGGQVGAKFSVAIAGELSDAATELVFSHPDIESLQQIEPESEYRVAHRKPNNFEVQIGPHVPPGRYEVRALGPAGLSGPRSFVVSSLANRNFDASGNAQQSPFPMAVGEAVNAKCRTSERDYFKFSAEQHRPLLIQVFAARIDSPMDAVLAVYESGGKRLHKIRQSLTRDPILSFTPPADGDYVIEVSDATYRGDLTYRLEVSELPWIEAIFPPVAVPGVESTFSIYGYNLPGGIPVSGLEQDGQLQSTTVQFVPELEDATSQAAWLSANSTSSARLIGQYTRLPDRLSAAPPVFLATSDQEILLEFDSTQDNPQTVNIPADIAGQFYPRRDRDWFQFEAKRNEPLWLELTTQQFGLPTDPAIRIQLKRVKDGKTTFQNIATADDMEGPPNSRDSRRFFSGTSDVALRFQAPEDGTYVASVQDQYNTALDDPRLTYRLTIKPQQPDFQLVAFADPERYPDDKIAKPNGVGILPGGTSAVRVRLLPQHDFAGPVEVRAEDLPPGVTADPLLLSPATKEGLLIFQASDAAEPTVASIQIVGQGRAGKTTLTRVAKTAAITRGVNNTDAEATKSRLTQDLSIAVLDVKAAPVSFSTNSNTVATSRGAKTPVTLTLARRDDLKDVELTVSAIQVPAGLKVDAQKTKTNQVVLTAQATDPNLKPGRYSLILASKLKDKRSKNPIKVSEAKGDLEKVSKLYSSAVQQIESEQKAAESLSAIATATNQLLEAAKSRSAEPRNKLTDNLRRQQQAAKSLQEQIELAINDIDDLKLQENVTNSENQISQLREERKSLQQQFETLLTELAELKRKHDNEQVTAKQATESLAKLTQRRDALKTEQEAAEKRFKDAEKAELQVEAEFWVFAQPITIDVKSSPVELQVNKHQIVQGKSAEIPVLLDRKFGFSGQVTVEADFPGDSGLSSTPLVLGNGISSGKLVVLAQDSAALKSHDVKLNIRLNFNGVDITESAAANLTVQPRTADEQKQE